VDAVGSVFCRNTEFHSGGSNVEIPGIKELWAESLGDPRVCIAVLDGPVDLSHPSLATANLRQLGTLVSGIANQGAASQHGTHIASVIFGQHDGPVKGIAPLCRGLIVPVFRDGLDGSLAPSSQLDLARAITQAVQEGAQVINISGGEFAPTGTAHPLLADAVQSCVNNGILIVAAAGNEGCDCLHIPGALPSVLVVGAMDSEGLPLDFSNWGQRYQNQGVIAPGESILGATSGGGTVTNSGTSYATPIVSGIAALLLSLQFKRGQGPNPHAVQAAILGSALGCNDQPVSDCRRLLAGRLNVKGAMSQVIEGGAAMSDSIETQEKENIRSHATETADYKKPPVSRPEAGVQAATLSGNGLEVTKSPQQSQATKTAAPQVQEFPVDQVSVETSRVYPSACSCGSGAPTQLVFVIGQLGYDFGTEARRDSIMQHMITPQNPNPNPHDPVQLLAYLETNPWDAAAIIWTLNFDATPVYAIRAQDPFASDIYQRLREFLSEQTQGKAERVSIPGYIAGSTRLFTGQVVPVIWPYPRCMFSWNTTALIEAICGKPPYESEKTQEQEAFIRKCEAVRNFLERVYHELRNLGITSTERAINSSATNALNVAKIFEAALKDKMQLDAIEVERSPICRPYSDCWDVKLIFFDPENQFTRAKKVYRFAVDVSDVCPVMVGQIRSWYVR